MSGNVRFILDLNPPGLGPNIILPDCWKPHSHLKNVHPVFHLWCIQGPHGCIQMGLFFLIPNYQTFDWLTVFGVWDEKLRTGPQGMVARATPQIQISHSPLLCCSPEMFLFFFAEGSVSVTWVGPSCVGRVSLSAGGKKTTPATFPSANVPAATRQTVKCPNSSPHGNSWVWTPGN